jgi:hypothetical protein
MWLSRRDVGEAGYRWSKLGIEAFEEPSSMEKLPLFGAEYPIKSESSEKVPGNGV